MNVTVNGKVRNVADNLTVQQLLSQFELIQERVAVEYNQRILNATDFTSVRLQEGDTLEIVRFVGGG